MTSANISYEFFPPKAKKAEARLLQTLDALLPTEPKFVSVTYGAGGSTQEKTLRIVDGIAAAGKVEVAAHLTCVGASKSAINNIAKRFWDVGVRHIVALRGDPPNGVDQAYIAHPDGYGYASDLITGLKNLGDFEISVSAYPERHPESASWDVELDNLKRKVDAGASRAITQFFFEADTFLRFRDRAVAAGINIPLVPGIMLQPNFNGVLRMAKMCKIHIPDWYLRHVSGLEDQPEVRNMLTASLAAELCDNLRQGGVGQFHFYTLNQSPIAMTVVRSLRLGEDRLRKVA